MAHLFWILQAFLFRQELGSLSECPRIRESMFFVGIEVLYSYVEVLEFIRRFLANFKYKVFFVMELTK